MGEEIQEEGGESTGASAASRVQGVIDAAEEAAARIVSDAKAQADRHVHDAERAAERIRAQSLAAAEEHLAAVEQATASLRSSLKLAGAVPPLESPASPESPGKDRPALSADRPALSADRPAPPADRAAPPADRAAPPADRAAMPVGLAPEQSTDLDGARLVALNMALSGDSREAIDRYLAAHFDLPRRAQLVDEVCTAVEG